MNEDRKARLGPNFTLGEFLVSDTYPERAAQLEPTAEEINNLYLLVTFGLQPIRDKFGPVVIHSGFRDFEINRLIGGSRTSQHLTGSAADFHCPSYLNQKTVFDWIDEELRWQGQVIHYTRRGFIHLGLPHFYILGYKKETGREEMRK